MEKTHRRKNADQNPVLKLRAESHNGYKMQNDTQKGPAGAGSVRGQSQTECRSDRKAHKSERPFIVN